jgi:effector-binding domain-containing protein
MGLLKPIHVDQFTGYRYYSGEQLSRLNRIVAFKDLGFSLEQIAELLNDEISPAQIRGMLRLKQAEVQRSIQLEQTRLAHIEARLQQIEQEDSVPTYDVVLKQVEAQTVAALRDVLPTCSNIKQLHIELTDYLQQHHIEITGILQTLWHDSEYRIDNVDAEAIAPINKSVCNSERIKTYTLPKVEQMACVIHQGSYDTIVQAFNALLKWIEANHYQVTGPNREIYIHPTAIDTDFTESTNHSVIEIQFPVQAA